jgi:hypothetical protein
MKLAASIILMLLLLVLSGACATPAVVSTEIGQTELEKTPTTYTAVPTETTQVGEPEQSIQPTETALPAQSTATSPLPIGESKLPSGTAAFRNKLGSLDQVVVTVQNFRPPENGQKYHAWLIADNSDTTYLGEILLSADGSGSLEWNSPEGKNLLAENSRVRITIETEIGDSPAGSIIIEGKFDDNELMILRSLFNSNQIEPATPRNKPFIQGMLLQFELAIQHIENALNADAIGARNEMFVHLEHVINILEGSNGDRFRDYTGDNQAQNPGDGFGAIEYAKQIVSLTPIHSEELISVVSNLENRVLELENMAIAILENRADAPNIEEMKIMGQDIQSNEVQKILQLALTSLVIQLEPIP